MTATPILRERLLKGTNDREKTKDGRDTSVNSTGQASKGEGPGIYATRGQKAVSKLRRFPQDDNFDDVPEWNHVCLNGGAR